MPYDGDVNLPFLDGGTDDPDSVRGETVKIELTSPTPNASVERFVRFTGSVIGAEFPIARATVAQRELTVTGAFTFDGYAYFEPGSHTEGVVIEIADGGTIATIVEFVVAPADAARVTVFPDSVETGELVAVRCSSDDLLEVFDLGDSRVVLETSPSDALEATDTPGAYRVLADTDVTLRCAAPGHEVSVETTLDVVPAPPSTLRATTTTSVVTAGATVVVACERPVDSAAGLWSPFIEQGLAIRVVPETRTTTVDGLSAQIRTAGSYDVYCIHPDMARSIATRVDVQADTTTRIRATVSSTSGAITTESYLAAVMNGYDLYGNLTGPHPSGFRLEREEDDLWYVVATVLNQALHAAWIAGLFDDVELYGDEFFEAVFGVEVLPTCCLEGDADECPTETDCTLGPTFSWPEPTLAAPTVAADARGLLGACLPADAFPSTDALPATATVLPHWWVREAFHSCVRAQVLFEAPPVIEGTETLADGTLRILVGVPSVAIRFVTTRPLFAPDAGIEGVPAEFDVSIRTSILAQLDIVPDSTGYHVEEIAVRSFDPGYPFPTGFVLGSEDWVGLTRVFRSLRIPETPDPASWLVVMNAVLSVTGEESPFHGLVRPRTDTETGEFRYPLQADFPSLSLGELLDGTASGPIEIGASDVHILPLTDWIGTGFRLVQRLGF